MPLITEIDYGTPASRSEKMVTLTIDGIETQVPEGTSIMRAAMDIGTKIPKLCATDMIEAFGSCRLCLVEIEGRAGTPASCTTPVAPAMVVKTQTERLKALRKGVMELYISDHPLDCLTCTTNGNCELQTEAGNVGLRDVRYGYDGANHLADRRTSPIPISPMIRRNASFATAAFAPARKCRGPSRSPSTGAASGAAFRRAKWSPSSSRNAFPAAPASRPVQPPRSPRSR
jgi:2Fe-2S iron-sulfur cluster binding domain/NADH-ubiquinone oxidoreductase-G iron-sulfur binding region